MRAESFAGEISKTTIPQKHLEQSVLLSQASQFSVLQMHDDTNFLFALVLIKELSLVVVYLGSSKLKHLFASLWKLFSPFLFSLFFISLMDVFMAFRDDELLVKVCAVEVLFKGWKLLFGLLVACFFLGQEKMKSNFDLSLPAGVLFNFDEWF